MAAGGPGLTDFSSPGNTRNDLELLAGTAPVITTTGPFSIAENSAVNDPVTTLNGTDDDGTLQNWTIVSATTVDVFSIDPSTGDITVANSSLLDYETIQSVTLTVTVSDGPEGDAATLTSAPVDIVINLTDVNEFTPVVEPAGPFTIAENTSTTTLIVKMTAKDDDGSATFSGWTISSGNSSGAFAIDASSGELTVVNSSVLDYETTTSFTIGVKVSDGTNLSEEETVTVNLVDLNDEIPVIDSGQGYTIDENTSVGTELGASGLTATDADAGTSFSGWIISSNVDPDGDGNFAFSINGDSGRLSVNDADDLDYETNPSLTIGVKVSDGLNLSDEETVTVSLVDLNDEIPIVTANQSFTIDENTSVGTAVGTSGLAATDADAGTSFSEWIISTNVDPDGDGNQAFSIDAGTGQLSVNDADDLDYETNPSLTIGVKVSDSKNLSAEQNVTINLNNLNDEAPVITADQRFSIPENSAYDYSVGTVAVTDPDSPLPTTYHDWSIKSGNTNGAFSIDASTGEIKVANSSELDLETTTSFTLGLTVNDGDNTSAQETVTIHLTDVNDIDPVITSDQSFDVDELSDNGTVVGTVKATDGDTTTTSFSSWTIKDGNTADNAFTINGTSGEITVANSSALDITVNPTFTLTLSVSDGVNTSADETVTISLTDINNQNPVVTNGQTFDVDENSAATTSVGTVAATDADSNTTFQNWTITSNVNGDGDANDAFAIDASTGEITVNDADDLDREANASLIIQVTVSDGANTSSAENVTINLNDVNDVIPVVDTGQSFSIAENSANGTVVGTATASDGDVSSTTFQNWTISSSTVAGAFAIDASTGQITVANSTALDRETVETITLGLTVGDGVNTSAAQDVTITLTDVNDVTPVITASQVFNVDEGSANATVVGTVAATDQDVTSTTFHDWTITGGNTDNAFGINASSGQITVTNSSALDFAVNPSFTLTLTVSDGTNTSAEGSVTINLNDVNNQAPVITADQTFTIDENSVNSNVVGTVAATDPDAGTTFQDWTIVSGNTNNAFAINVSTGEITVATSTALDKETTSSFTLSLTVSDGVNTSAEQTIAITLNDLNDEVPVVTANQTFSIDENSANGSSVGTVLATDGDVTATTFQNWTITDGNTNGAFAINGSTGEITVAKSTELNREVVTSYTLTVTVDDGVNTSAAQTLTVDVNDVNDVLPVITANQSFTIDENSVGGTVVGTLTATDGDVTATTFQTWQIVSNVNGDGDVNNAFTINTGTGEITVNDAGDLDREAASSFTIGVTVSDGVNTSAQQDVVIYLNDLNDEAPVITANQSFSIDENSPDDMVIGTLVATDIDVTATTFENWRIVSNVNPDNDVLNAFGINDATGEIFVNDSTDLDREANASLTIQVTVSDGVNTSDPVDVVINLNELNDVAPVVTANQSFTIKEKSDVGTTAGTLAATDGDISATTFQNWLIATNIDVDGDGTGAFALNIDTGVLTVADSDDLDREQNASLTIRVTVGDGVNTSDTADVVVNLSDTNNQPPVVTAGQSFPVNENTTNRTEVGTVVATDADVTATTFRDWTIVGGNDAGTFAINDSTGVITVADSTLLDRETIESIVLSITVSDSINVSAPEDVTITLNDVNDVAPVVTADQSFTIEENSANDLVIGTLVATDGDVSATTFQNWNILTGNASGTFALDESTGALSVADSTALDRETTSSFTLGVVTGDGVNTGDTVDVVINLTDVNDVTPVVTADQSFNVDENSVAGTTIGTVLATDGDVTPTTFTNWTISTGNDDNAFAIDSLSGVLSVNDPATLDREVLDSLIIGVFVSDGLDTSVVQNVTIHLNDVNDVLPVIAADSTFAIDENSPAGTVVGTASATDGDVTPTTFSNWTIVDGNTGGAFAIDGNSGQITVAQSSALDREKIDTLKLSVTVSDGVNTSAPELVIVTLNDVNDILPVIAAGQSFTLPENTVVGTSVGKIEVADSDVTASTFNNWQISTNFDGNGDGNPTFAIDSLSGNLTVNDPGDLDFETVPDFNIAVTVDDSVNTSLPVEVALHLTDKNDNAPVIITMPYFTIQENSEIGTLVAQFEATDVDVTPATFTWHIVKNTDPDMDGAEAFIINESNGNLYIRDKDDFDYEANDELKVRISVWDGINRSDYLEVIIGITNDTSDDVTTGLDDLALKEVKVYPNPAQSYFYIDGPVGETVHLIDMNGRLVKTALMESNIQRFDLSGTPKGIYLVQIQHKTVSKVIVR
ncbi:cellulosome anchoring protein [Prolixibacter sp. NT017]|nr:cellulosome anchoring protein [Prolixibacter sp. NT017]